MTPHAHVTFELVLEHVDGPFVRACTIIDGVPYYGSGPDPAAAVRHLADTIRAHGAPLPPALSHGAYHDTDEATP